MVINLQSLNKLSAISLDEACGTSLCFASPTEEIGIGEMKKLSPPDVGITEGLGPCLGIAIINKETGKAALGHYPSPMHGNDFNDFINDAISHAGPPEALSLTLSGCGDEIDKIVEDMFPGECQNNVDSTERKRAEILQFLLDWGFQVSNISLAWGRGEEVMDLYVDCRNCKVAVFSHTKN